MKALFNNLLSKIMACALVTAVSMPTPAFSATSVSDDSLVKELLARGVWLYCDENAHSLYDIELRVERDEELLRILEDAIGQCEISKDKIASAEEHLAKAEKRGSTLAPYLLLQLHYSRERYIPSNKFKQLFGLIRTQDLKDRYFLGKEIKNKILLGLIELVYLFGEEILLDVGNEEKQRDNINAYMSIINTMFPSESSNCNTLLDGMLSEVQSALNESRSSHLRERFPSYKKTASWVKEGICPKFMASIEKIKATAKEKGIAIE